MVKIISIEGNIGSGKSTLIERLKVENNSFVYLPEPVDIWTTIKDAHGKNILEKYYSDQKRYAFPFQMMAYITRLSQLREAVKKGEIIITERCLLTDRYIFAQMLFDTGKIEDIEYAIYLKWFDEFLDNNVSGLIYIKIDPDLCSKRIIERNRKGEDISLEYLKDCDRYHEKWMNDTKLPTLILDDNIDIQKIYNFIKFV